MYEKCPSCLTIKQLSPWATPSTNDWSKSEVGGCFLRTETTFSCNLEQTPAPGIYTLMNFKRTKAQCSSERVCSSVIIYSK